MDADGRLLDAESIKEVKFHAAIKQMSSYRVSRDVQQRKELKAIKEIIRNPLKLSVYRHNRKKSDNITSSSIEQIYLENAPIDFSLKVDLKDAFYEIKPQVYIRGRRLPIAQLTLKMEYFLVENGCYYLVDSLALLNFLHYFKKQGSKLLIHASKFTEFQHEILDSIEKSVRIEYTYVRKAPPAMQKEFIVDNTLEKIIYISEEEAHILLTPAFRYGNHEIMVGSLCVIFRQFKYPRPNRASRSCGC